MDTDYRPEVDPKQIVLDSQQLHSKETGAQEEEDRLMTVDDILNFYSNQH